MSLGLAYIMLHQSSYFIYNTDASVNLLMHIKQTTNFYMILIQARNSSEFFIDHFLIYFTKRLPLLRKDTTRENRYLISPMRVDSPIEVGQLIAIYACLTPRPIQELLWLWLYDHRQNLSLRRQNGLGRLS